MLNIPALVTLFLLAPLLAAGGPSPTRFEHKRKMTASSIAKRSTPSRYVFSHVVMGNWQSYQPEDWKNDILLAQRSGVDAFALNVGHDASDPAQLDMAYTAAETLGFKLFISLDMTYTSLFGSAANIVAEYITPFASRSSQFMYKGKALLSTFSGETSATYLEGNANINSAWASLKSLAAAAGHPVVFMPFWTALAAETAVSSHPAVDGIGSWAAWPTGNAARSTTIDEAFEKDALSNNKQFIAPVSPWFSVHLTSGNNYIYRSDEWLLATRYEQLLKMETVPTFIELLTVNDYGESHYLGPVRANGGLPTGTVDSSTYVDGAVHQSILGLVKFYNEYFKTGAYPTVTETQAFYWYRPHPKSAVATADALGRPSNWDSTDDAIYVAVIVKPGSAIKSVKITSGGSSTTTPVAVGKVNLVKMPFKAGTPEFSLLDTSGKSRKSMAGPKIGSSPTVYDFNYRAGSLSCSA